MRPILLLAVAASTLLPARAAHAQAVPFDAARLSMTRDSFAVVVQGAPLGWQVMWLEKTADGFVYHEKSQVGPSTSETAITFDRDLVMQSSSITGLAAGQEVSVTATYADGRAKGVAKMPTAAGVQETPVDLAVPADVVDDAAMKRLITALPWADNGTWQVTVMSAAAGQVVPLTIAAGEKKQVTVPAGTFEVYAADLSGAGQPVTMYVTAAAPHRVVKIDVAGMLEFMLVK